MGGKIGRCLRRAARCEVGGRRHQHPRQRRKLARTEGGIVEFADADRDVGTIGDEILSLIGD